MRSPLRLALWHLACSVVAGGPWPASSQTQPDSALTWEFAAEPNVSIGLVDGPLEYLLYNPVAAASLPGGSIALMQSLQRSFEISFFDEHGQFQRTVSRWGEGPFEFEGAIAFDHSPGGIWVVGFDARAARFGVDGQHAEASRLPSTPGLVRYAEAMDSSILAVGKAVPSAMGRNGIQTSSIRYEIADMREGAAIEVVTAQGATFHVLRRGGRSSNFPLPFRRRALAAAGNGILWVAASGDPLIVGYDRKGNPAVTIDASPGRRSVTRGDLRRFRENALNGLDGERLRQWQDFVDATDYPDSLPAIQKLSVDEHGQLWVLKYSVPWSTDDQWWNVYSRRGELVAEVVLPAAAAERCRSVRVTLCDPILDIGFDGILLRRQDRDTGTWRVEKHALVR